MPIEIRELVIKATVNELPVKKRTTGTGSGDADQELIIAECVEQVQDIIKDRSER